MSAKKKIKMILTIVQKVQRRIRNIIKTVSLIRNFTILNSKLTQNNKPNVNSQRQRMRESVGVI